MTYLARTFRRFGLEIFISLTLTLRHAKYPSTYSVVIHFCDEFRLEGKKREKKPEIKDPKLQELQERLEARKAGK